MSTLEIAEKFVNLILKYEDWDRVMELSTEEKQVLFETVSTAGFKTKDFLHGRIYIPYTDSGEKCPINSFFPFKIIDQEGKDCEFATGWLDCAVQRVFCGAIRSSEPREKLIRILALEIERSVPYQPIQITVDGDFMSEFPPRLHNYGFRYFVDHTRDDSRLEFCVGVHEHCGDHMDRQGATETKDAILCRKCHLRVLFPKEIKTYGALRQEIAKRIYDSLPEGGVHV